MISRREQQAEQNRRRVLEATALAFLLLRRKRNAAVSTGLSRGLPILKIENLIRDDVTEALKRSQLVARTLGSQRLSDELESLEVSGYQPRVSPRELLVDAHRAHLGADSYAEQWAKAATETSARKASAATDYVLRRTAISDASRAFNEARLERARELPADIVAQLDRVWDAEYGACPVCAAEDGTIVGLDQPFPLGEPGSVHKNCCCSWSLVGSSGALIH